MFLRFNLRAQHSGHAVLVCMNKYLLSHVSTKTWKANRHYASKDFLGNICIQCIYAWMFNFAGRGKRAALKKLIPFLFVISRLLLCVIITRTDYESKLTFLTWCEQRRRTLTSLTKNLSGSSTMILTKRSWAFHYHALTTIQI